MANAYYTFASRFIAGTKVKSAEVNAQFDGVVLGFDGVEAALTTATTASVNASASAAASAAAAAAAQLTANSGQTTALAALARSGGVMTNFITLHANASSALHPVPKQQFDTALALKANAASPVFTGNVEVPVPSLTTDAASKGYVDGQNLAQDAARAALLAVKADLASPNLTGIPTTPTATNGTNTTQIASTAFVQNSVAASVAGVASFQGRTGIVTLLLADITSGLGYSPFNPAGTLPTLTVSGSGPWTYYRDTDLAANASGLWSVGSVDGTFRVRSNTAVAADFSTFDAVLDVSSSTFSWMANGVWHAGNLTSLSQLSNSPGYINVAGAPVQSVFGRTGSVVLGVADITTTLGYTPVQQGSGVGQSSNVIKIGWSAGSKLKATVDATDLGNIALETWVAAQNYLTGITSTQVTNALGYTPYNSTNPAGYMNNAAVNASYMPRTGGTFTGDITMSRAGSPGTGVVFLGNTGSRYLFFDGGTYQMPGAPLNVGGLVFGNGAGSGLGAIYISTGTPSGGNNGDLWLQYA